MFCLITLFALATASPAFGAHPNAKGISIPLKERTLPTEDGMAYLEALAHQTNQNAVRYPTKEQKIRVLKKPDSSIKARNPPLDRSRTTGAWTAEIQIGSPPQYFDAVLSTGSMHTWVISSTCIAEECSSNKKYDPLKSTTGMKVSNEFTVKYTSGLTVSGPVYSDTVTVGGFSVESQMFTSVNYLQGLSPGVEPTVLGFAVSHKVSHTNPTFIDTLAYYKQISHRIFSIYLSSGFDSELYIGGTNPEKHHGEIHYLPRQDNTFWSVEGIASVNSEVRYKGKMVLDSGLPTIIGPIDSVKLWWDMVPGARSCKPEICGALGFFLFPCDNAPSFSFTFNEREFTFAPEELILDRLQSHPGDCVGAIHRTKTLKDRWILGTRFMKSVYTVFDADKSQVGFATPV
ncbi:aspartic protease [Rhizoctonia solani AG-3 Rhs1AP]|uniref:Aspartic protease n=1 Tax=Rhizoctonia solani AG-3 Rhs1AP TaxID=1086054 RepID=X8IZX9_9AGAM|nr:aspartic protease [Rhizoctonia solani AG-3 Rhs1AP]